MACGDKTRAGFFHEGFDFFPQSLGRILDNKLGLPFDADEFPEAAARLVPIRQYNGLPLDAQTVLDGVLGDRAAAREFAR